MRQRIPDVHNQPVKQISSKTRQSPWQATPSRHPLSLMQNAAR
jgi:hypothetical protein